LALTSSHGWVSQAASLSLGKWSLLRPGLLNCKLHVYVTPVQQEAQRNPPINFSFTRSVSRRNSANRVHACNICIRRVLGLGVLKFRRVSVPRQAQGCTRTIFRFMHQTPSVGILRILSSDRPRFADCVDETWSAADGNGAALVHSNCGKQISL
jgi:hypothetical protein